MAALLWRVSLIVLASTMVVATQPPTDLVELTGTVRDESGAALPGVVIELVSLTTAEDSSTTITDSQGRFSVRARPGPYEVRASLPGFQVVTQRVALRVGSSPTVNLRFSAHGLPPPTTSPPPPLPPPVPGAQPGGRGGTPPPPLPSTDTHALVPVFFATDREVVPGPTLAYGTARAQAENLYLGRFDVSIPRDVHAIGTVERPNIWSFWREDPDRHFVIRQRVQHTYDGFYSDIRRLLEHSTVRQAFVFIHGYNVLFDDAVYRTAQLAYDLGFDGAPVLYSWPSVGSEVRYPVDLNNAEWTVPRLRWFLEDMATRSGAEVVHVIAHSMGNRPVVSALNRIAAESSTAVRSRFRQIVLTAPDIDAATFRGLAAALPRVGERVTLYASSNDVALKLSHKYQGYQRAGDTIPRVVVMSGVDTVDVSALDTGFLGHSYYGDNRSVIADLFYLIRDGLEPSRRAGLKASGQPPERYWVFRR